MLIQNYFRELANSIESSSGMDPEMEKLLEEGNFTDEQYEIIAEFESYCIKKGMSLMISFKNEIKGG